MKKDINKKACFVCGSTSNPKIIAKHKHWKLYECTNCTFQYWWPIEQASSQYFVKNYKSFSNLANKPNFGINHRMALRLIKSRIKKHNNINNMLDVGCGEGTFLSKIYNINIHGWGVDFNPKAINKAKKLFKLKNLFVLSIYDFAKKKKLPKFNLITFFEVLEHIGDPLNFINAIKQLLVKNGIVIFSVPDADSYGRWETICNTPPHHLTRWTKNTIKQFLNHNGFKILKIRNINRPDSECSFINFSFRIGVKKNCYATFSPKAKTFWKYFSLPYRQIVYLLRLKRPTIFVVAQLK